MGLVEKIIKAKLDLPDEDLYYIPDQDIIDELTEICEKVHSSCNDGCPVHKINSGPVKQITSLVKTREIVEGCDCFKNGKAMFNFLKNQLS